MPDGEVADNATLAKLDDLIGLAAVKAELRKLVDFCKVRKLRKEQGLETTGTILHLVFFRQFRHRQDDGGAYRRQDLYRRA
jgi:hypothetical protein